MNTDIGLYLKRIYNSTNLPIVGILLRFQQSKSGEPRMVFTFDFVNQEQIGRKDEPVSLEVIKVKKAEEDSTSLDGQEG